MSKRRIVLVEDERDMAELVAMRLKREHCDVQIALDGPEGLAKIRDRPPDLVILDIMLPGLSGTELLRQLRADPRTAHVPAIMLTARGEDGDIVGALQVGADDYVTKPFSMSVLVARIEAVLRRYEAAGETERGVLTAGPIRVNQDTHQVSVDGRPVSLTRTEFRLLAAIIVAKGRVLSRDQLIDRVISPDAVVTDRTIDVHLTALRRKLGKARKYVHTVRGIGYRLMAEEDETA